MAFGRRNHAMKWRAQPSVAGSAVAGHGDDIEGSSYCFDAIFV